MLLQCTINTIFQFVKQFINNYFINILSIQKGLNFVYDNTSLLFSIFYYKDTLHEGSGPGQVQDWRDKTSHFNLDFGNFSQSDFGSNYGN